MGYSAWGHKSQPQLSDQTTITKLTRYPIIFLLICDVTSVRDCLAVLRVCFWAFTPSLWSICLSLHQYHIVLIIIYQALISERENFLLSQNYLGLFLDLYSSI